ncbi:MAG TPA: methyltransferase domain-containing protein [Patescibacteria group bacterium]|nr:methyltransferase domain-containing protein [Patescibacteria group bacterium]
MKKTKVQIHFDKVAKKYDFYKKRNSFYYDNLKKLLLDLIPSNKNVFEIGCGTGDLLAHLRPRRGYGVDLSNEMILIAKRKYKRSKNLKFSTTWPHDSDNFNYIFMSDVIEHLENPETIFKKTTKLMKQKTIFICTMMNPIWEPVELIYEKLGLKMPEGPHNRMKYKELKIKMELSGMKVIKHDYKLLIPIKIPIITSFLNKYLETPLKRFSIFEYVVATKA